MKAVLCAVRLDPCGGWSLSESGLSSQGIYILNMKFVLIFYVNDKYKVEDIFFPVGVLCIVASYFTSNVFGEGDDMQQNL